MALTPVILLVLLLRSPNGKQNEASRTMLKMTVAIPARFERAALVRRETSQIAGD